MYKSAGTSRLVLSLFVLRPCKINTLLPGTSQRYIHMYIGKVHTARKLLHSIHYSTEHTGVSMAEGGGAEGAIAPSDFVRI